ncbi:MAG: helix-turn-helix transcriptional regulator [Planctomycetia bacterium]|nr:helix-turn-helix transcriptional regulator [Planctomycetia bacterium]
MEKKATQRLFGEVVRECRQNRKVSQETLAAAAGLHRTYISLLERGMRNPSLTVIQHLASALKVSMTELIHAFEERC